MAKRVSSRRQFLVGRSAADAVENFVDGVKAERRESASANQTANLAPPVATYLLELARDAMAVEFQVFLNAGEFANGPETAVAALDLLEPLEAQMTVYRESSEVSRINQFAALRDVSVEARLFRLLVLAQRIAEETGGAYDMTSGPLSKVWGFYRRQGRMPSDEEIAAAREHVGHHLVQLDDARRTIRFAREGVELNLGGIGKGHALDRMSELLQMNDVSSYLLHGGQSSVLARGTRLGESHGDGWLIGVAHPLKTDARLCEFRLVNRALGTSGSGTQFFHHQGKKYAHILDPRTGRPADVVLSSTVLAPTAAQADALSTAFYVGGRELAEKYCAQHKDISALIVVPGQKAGELEVERFNLKVT